MASGKLIVITGPSGVGKGTLVRSLLQKYPDLYLSISATTRPPRPGEKDGQDYHFLTRTAFEEMINQGELLEWAEYAGNYYGTPRKTVEEQVQKGQRVILEIEVVGARLIQESFPDALRIFILPPSLEELERRLRGRGNDPEMAIQKRLKRAEAEIAVAAEFDLQILNEQLDKAFQSLETVIMQECKA